MLPNHKSILKILLSIFLDAVRVSLSTFLVYFYSISLGYFNLIKYTLDTSFTYIFKHSFITASILLQSVLQGSLQEATTRTLTRYITNNHLQSLVQNTLQRKLQQAYNIRCVSSTRLLH